MKQKSPNSRGAWLAAGDALRLPAHAGRPLDPLCPDPGCWGLSPRPGPRAAGPWVGSPPPHARAAPAAGCRRSPASPLFRPPRGARPVVSRAPAPRGVRRVRVVSLPSLPAGTSRWRSRRPAQRCRRGGAWPGAEARGQAREAGGRPRVGLGSRR